MPRQVEHDSSDMQIRHESKSRGAEYNAAKTRDPSARKNEAHTDDRTLVTLIAGLAVLYFWYSAAGTCPGTANDKAINRTQCALAIIFGGVFMLIGVAVFTGILRLPRR